MAQHSVCHIGMQNSSNSSVLAMELLQPSTRPSIYAMSADAEASQGESGEGVDNASR